jgi:glc operon protein GlcG
MSTSAPRTLRPLTVGLFLALSGSALAGPPGAVTRKPVSAPATERARVAAAASPAATVAPAPRAVTSKSSLTLEGAARAVAAAVAKARSLRAAGVVAVVDEGGNLMALERLDGTFAAGANISIGKARTAVLFNKPTRIFEEIIKNGRTPMVALNDFTPLQGGVPIVVDGRTVGGIGVSGAASAAQDEELAIAGASALAGSSTDVASYAPPAAPALPVSFFSHEQVGSAFAKGGVLLENGSFKVHASRREAAGLAEVHDLDADIAYVREGNATLVTGGTLVNARGVGPSEQRGDAIVGGQERELTVGDVVVIPKGVPHWFKRVSNPFTYFVVKAH